MKTYINILQLHAKTKHISYPDNLTAVKLCNTSSEVGSFLKHDVPLPSVVWNRTVDESSNTNYWTCVLREEVNGELGYEDNSVHHQLYFFIHSMAYFYSEPLGKLISRKHLLINQSTHNMFLSTDTTSHLREIFYKSQRTYLAIARFANIVRHKIYKSKIESDLRMEPIDITSKYAVTLLQNGSKYCFILSDLINIIHNAITYSQDCFSKPLWPKNPYNNVPLSIAHLYNIYFQTGSTYLTIPHWFYLFFMSRFDLNTFSIENEQALREHHIKGYVLNGSVDDLYNDFQNMRKFNKDILRDIHIHEHFPKKDLVDIFRPYVYLYIFSMDSIDGTEKKRMAYMILRQKLTEFVKYNCNFGRKVVKISYITTNNSTLDNSHNLFQSNRVAITKTSYNKKHYPFTMTNSYLSFYKKTNYSSHLHFSYNDSSSTTDDDNNESDSVS